MRFCWIPVNSAWNERGRGLPFDLAVSFEWDNALVLLDERFDDGEDRRRASGDLNGRLHVVIFADRDDMR